MAPDEFLKAIHTIGPFRHPAEGSPFNETLVAEVAIWTAILGVTAALLIIQPKFVEDVEAALKRLARKPVLACVTVGLAALALRLALLPVIPYPVPKYHDEYSYILQAQTFAAGRVANPAHPLWVHFETFHVNMLPTYASMYPPAQATFLAIGQVLTGKPWWGVWLSIGILCACVTWMLQAWMPAPWALLGGLFCLLRYDLFSYWVNSYWGGAAAAIGGALLFGALPRLMRRPRVSLAIIIALALMILANSRPYEGFIFAVPSMVWLLVWTVRKQMWNLRFAKQVVVPAALVLILGSCFMLYYNWRCTGHPTLMPYMLNQATYHISKPFLWQKPNPIPNYHHLVMRTFYCFHELPYAVRARTAWGIQELTEEKFGVYYGFFIWPLLLLFIPAMWQ